MLECLSPATPDPILSLSIDFKNDTRPEKMDLGIGIYKDSQGNTPIMQAVKTAQLCLANEQTTKSYVGLAGNESFNRVITDLLLSEKSDANQRSATVQTPGASGALRMLADLIYLAKPTSKIWISAPSYVNHQPIMEAAGLDIRFYPYFDTKNKQVDANAMLDTLAKVGSDDVVLLHGCCHNPTGADMAFEHWQAITELAQKKGFTPFVDMAYQGLGSGLEQDARGIRFLADSVEEMIVATSCSKNFGLYRERTGAAIVIGKHLKNATIAKQRILQLARSTYTMPPDHGASIVEMILSSESLSAQWREELNGMRNRIINVRQCLTAALSTRFGDSRYDFIEGHQGMFSMLGLSLAQIARLKSEFGIYIVGDSRVNIAGIKESDLDYLADALVAVTKD